MTSEYIGVTERFGLLLGPVLLTANSKLHVHEP